MSNMDSEIQLEEILTETSKLLNPDVKSAQEKKRLRNGAAHRDDDELSETSETKSEISYQNISMDADLFNAVSDFKDVKVVRLLRNGANLLAVNSQGMTPMHCVVLASAHKPSSFYLCQRVLEAVLKNIVTWFCGFKEIKMESADQDRLYQHAVLYVFSGEHSDKYPNILCYAAQLGATDFMKFVMNIKGVFRLEKEESNVVRFDVTAFVPSTSNKRPFNEYIESLYPKDPSKEQNENSNNCHGCLMEYLIRRDDKRDLRILALPIFQKLNRKYWQPYVYLYIIMSLVHLAHIVSVSIGAAFLTSHTVNACLEIMETNRSILNHTDMEDHFAEVDSWRWGIGFTLWWPILVVCQTSQTLYKAFRQYCRVRTLAKDSQCSKDTNLYKELGNAFGPSPFWIAGYVSGVMIVIWFIAHEYILRNIEYYCESYRSSGDTLWRLEEVPMVVGTKHVAAVAIMFGWFYLIHLTQGFRIIHKFAFVVVHLVIHDVPKFLPMFTCMFLGAMFALHVQISDIEVLHKYDKSKFSTFYLLLNLVLGLEQPFLITFNSEKALTKIAVMGFYIFLMVMVNLLLLTMTIALMNDSYSKKAKHHKEEWLILTARCALEIEERFPIVIKFLQWSRKSFFYEEQIDVTGYETTNAPLMRFFFEIQEKTQKSENTPSYMVSVIQQLSDQEKTIQEMARKLSRLEKKKT